MEDKKTYDFKGTVTIGTDEYRDLITDVITFKKESEEYRSKYWNEQCKSKSLESSIAALKEELQRSRDFIESKKEYRLAYKMYIAGVEDTDAE